MLESGSRSLIDHFRKVRLPSKGMEEYIPDKKNLSGLPNSTLTKLMKINHRRKFQPLEEKKVLLHLWKKKSFNESLTKEIVRERFSCASELQDTDAERKASKRNTFHQTDAKQDRGCFRRIISGHSLCRSRSKFSIDVCQETEKEDSPAAKGGLRGDKGHVKRKSLLRESPKILKRTTKIVNKSAMDFRKEGEEESLVSLISKFKFENLKTAEQSPVSHERQEIGSKAMLEGKEGKQKKEGKEVKAVFMKQSLFFQPLCKQSSMLRDSKKEKMSKTMPKFGWRRDCPPSSIKRKVSVLSPWEMHSQEPVVPMIYYE